MLYDIHSNDRRRKENKQKRKFTENNMSSLNDARLSEDWSDVLEGCDVGVAFDLFDGKFCHHFDGIILFVRMNDRSVGGGPWIAIC